MPYRVLPHETVPGGLRRLVEEQIDRAVAEIDDKDLDPHATVHQVRKRGKKIRAVLRLAHGPLDEAGVYDRENAWYRDAARPLSPIRGAEALRETYDDLLDHFGEEVERGAFAPFRGALTRRRREISEDAGVEERLQEFRRRMVEGRRRVPVWTAELDGFDALEAGLRKTYERGRKALEKAYEDPTPERFHEWRKRVKYHGYHCRLLRAAWPPLLKARAGEAKALADLLGDAHDLDVFLRTLEQESERFPGDVARRALVALLKERRATLRRRARPLGPRLFAEKGKRLSNRWRTWWGVRGG